MIDKMLLDLAASVLDYRKLFHEVAAETAIYNSSNRTWTEEDDIQVSEAELQLLRSRDCHEAYWTSDYDVEVKLRALPTDLEPKARSVKVQCQEFVMVQLVQQPGEDAVARIRVVARTNCCRLTTRGKEKP